MSGGGVTAAARLASASWRRRVRRGSASRPPTRRQRDQPSALA